MRNTLPVLGVALALVFAVSAASSQDAAKDAAKKDGKALFLENKCNSCHSVDAQKIEKKKAAGAEEGEDASASKKKAPDLSSAGLDFKADFFVKYLNKTADIKGEKHTKKWKGTPEDLQIMATWLEAQKAPKKKEAAK